MSNISYHLTEMEIAKNGDDTRNILPVLHQNDDVVLDIGCRIGQTFVALNCLNRRCIGVDIDPEAINYGKKLYGDNIEFHLSSAEKLPVESESCNLVICRVSLPYTNIPRVLREIKRVLKPNGRVWLTIHDLTLAKSYFLDAWRKDANWKRKLHVIYILLNGYSLKVFGKVFPFINGKYESWQDYNALIKLLYKENLNAKILDNNSLKYIEAKKVV